MLWNGWWKKWDKVFKSGLSKFCGKQPKKIYLAHFWILCPKCVSTVSLIRWLLSVESRLAKERSLKIPFHVFKLLSIPLAKNKIGGPSTTLEFLGITLYTVALEARISAEKITLRKSLKLFLGKRKCTKRDLLGLVGSLSFLGKVVVWGRTFLSHLIQLCYPVHELHLVYSNRNIKGLSIFFWKRSPCWVR